MARDDLLKRYQDAGFELLEATRARAEEFIKELTQVGDAAQARSRDHVDDFVEGSRRQSEQIVAVIRGEIAHQLTQFGFATKAELRDLERRFTAHMNPPAAPADRPPDETGEQG